MQQENFGEYLHALRQRKKITLKSMSEELNISTTYLCDIESNRRNPPAKEKLDALVSFLTLTDAEKNHFYDLAGSFRNGLAPDVETYIVNNAYITTSIRMVRDAGATQDDWNEFADRVSKRSN